MSEDIHDLFYKALSGTLLFGACPISLALNTAENMEIRMLSDSALNLRLSKLAELK